MRHGDLGTDSSVALELLSSVNIESSVAVFIQIENHVQFAISAGLLKPTSKLPSVRELSDRLKLNPNTVAKAYRDLEVMGIVFTRRGMGVYVAPGVEKKCRENCLKSVTSRVYEVACEARSAGISRKTFDAIVAKSYASGNLPYGEVPDEVMRVAHNA